MTVESTKNGTPLRKVWLPVTSETGFALENPELAEQHAHNLKPEFLAAVVDDLTGLSVTILDILNAFREEAAREAQL